MQEYVFLLETLDSHLRLLYNVVIWWLLEMCGIFSVNMIIWSSLCHCACRIWLRRGRLWHATHDCVAPYVDIILHRGRFWAKSAASESVRWWCFRSCWMVLSHVMRGRPSCLLQSAGAEANRILLASALSSMRIICPNKVSRRDRNHHQPKTCRPDSRRWLPHRVGCHPCNNRSKIMYDKSQHYFWCLKTD